MGVDILGTSLGCSLAFECEDAAPSSLRVTGMRIIFFIVWEWDHARVCWARDWHPLSNRVEQNRANVVSLLTTHYGSGGPR